MAAPKATPSGPIRYRNVLTGISVRAEPDCPLARFLRSVEVKLFARVA